MKIKGREEGEKERERRRELDGLGEVEGVETALVDPGAR